VHEQKRALLQAVMRTCALLAQHASRVKRNAVKSKYVPTAATTPIAAPASKTRGTAQDSSAMGK